MLRLTIILVLTIIRTSGAVTDGPFKFEKKNGRVTLTEWGKPVFSFQTALKSQAGKYPRANYLHPVYDPDGNIVTEDFPADHLHHRGIFWAWHQVLQNGKAVCDPWVCQNVRWGKANIALTTPTKVGYPGPASVRVYRAWGVPTDSGETNFIMREDITVAAQPLTNGIRRLDFTLRFRALSEGVTLGGSDDVKGYGGFSPRIRLSEDVRFIGQTGPVKPQKTAVDGGAWMNVTRTLDGKKRGITILVHPSHPDFPLKWILRKKHSMQNPQWPGRQPVPISKQEDTVLRYRLLLHNNLLKSEQIEQEWNAYATGGISAPTGSTRP